VLDAGVARIADRPQRRAQKRLGAQPSTTLSDRVIRAVTGCDLI
jgi:hypothetical protein